MRDKKTDWNDCHLPQQPNDFNQEPPTWRDCGTAWVYENGKLIAVKEKGDAAFDT